MSTIKVEGREMFDNDINLGDQVIKKNKAGVRRNVVPDKCCLPIEDNRIE